jgi:hypothetical protein
MRRIVILSLSTVSSRSRFGVQGRIADRIVGRKSNTRAIATNSVPGHTSTIFLTLTRTILAAATGKPAAPLLTNAG